MSSFLSEKYLKYRGALLSRPDRHIDDDLPCTGCGYNLRGLSFGRNCPECGQLIGRPPAGASSDPLLSRDASSRSLISLGLTIGAWCLVAALLSRLILFVGSVLGIGPLDARTYLVMGFIISGLWWMACAMMIRGAPVGGPRWNRAAAIAAWSQALWLPGYALLALRVNAAAGGPGNEELLHAASLLVRASAGVGALGVAYFMMRAAEDAELEDAVRRLNTVIWVLPIITLLLAPVPSVIGWITAVIVFMVLLPWCWFMWTWALSLWQMHRHIAWAGKIALTSRDHLARIDKTKRRIEEQLEAAIRPVGGSSPELPLPERGSGTPIRQPPAGVANRPEKRGGEGGVEFMG